MTYRYTGYSVNGVEVFIWILLTAGSISFPVIVLTICCIRLHIRNNKKTKHLSHLLDGDAFDRKSKAAGFNRYFFDQKNLNETSTDNSASASPTHKKPVQQKSPSFYSGGERVLAQLGKPIKNTYMYSTHTTTTTGAPIINNRDAVINRDIYSISDSCVNTEGVDAVGVTTATQSHSQSYSPSHTVQQEVTYAKVDTAFEKTTALAVATSVGDNFETLYSQVTKKPSTRNSSVRNEQALYMNTFYSNS